MWGAVALFLAGVAAPARAHLLVSEVGYDTVDETNPTSEFVEILNPDPSPVPLASFWLIGDEDAYPLLVNGPVSPITLNNFIYRFPAITLGSGRIAVVCQDGDAFLAEHFPSGLAAFLAQPGGPILFEVTQDGAGDGVPDMIPWGSNPAGTLSMANNGECVGLASWDGISDRVVDHDWVCWLTTNAIPDKDVDYPLGVDGPDANLESTWYSDDHANGIPAPDAPQGSSIHRTSLVEKGEITTGGNGWGGHDETSEDWSVWAVGPPTPGRATLSVVGVTLHTDVEVTEPRLTGAAPNPFAREVRLDYVLPHPGHVRLTIHDLQGRLVATLVDEPEPSGTHTVSWSSRDDLGARAGILFARLECEGVVRRRTLGRIRN